MLVNVVYKLALNESLFSIFVFIHIVFRLVTVIVGAAVFGSLFGLFDFNMDYRIKFLLSVNGWVKLFDTNGFVSSKWNAFCTILSQRASCNCQKVCLHLKQRLRR